MKKTILAAAIATVASCATAQEGTDIALQAPNKDRGASIMKSLADRQSARECSGKDLSAADLSDLLWAANGINRAEEGKRTAPSAMNRQEIDIYAFMKKGAYKYLPSENKLQLVAEGDHRDAVGGFQDFVKDFPVTLVMVADLSRFSDLPSDKATLFAAMDAGYVSQNICLFCSGTGLVTVPRASMDSAKLKELLRLGDTQVPLLNNPVGYKKE